MIYKINCTEDKLLEDIYQEAMTDLNIFYELNWIENLPKVIVIDDRKTINYLKNMETENWVIGWSEGRNIYVLNRDNFERESSHKYDKEQYSAFIKHELSHCFTDVLSGYSMWKPKWLWEGIATYTSGQNTFKNKIAKFENFLTFYDQSSHKDVYKESGFAVELLVKKFGKEKLLDLIKNLKNYQSKQSFELAFEKQYGFFLNYENFNKLFC